MNLDLLNEAFQICRLEQAGDRYMETPEKNKALEEAISVFNGKGKLLDIGGCPYSKIILEKQGFEVTQWLFEHGDMHELDAKEQYDQVLARHVLEHSPFPLFLLLLIKQVLKSYGEAVIVVPEPKGRWVLKHNGHASTLMPDTWEKLFGMAGFDIRWGSYGHWTKTGEIEYRYLLRKKV